ncbi:tripartite motif-containing protein 16-like [Tachysurus vachellii]|uniref:tripartite motif-containing protein 16-like n=1 Tax=Tachysurus vachellii TaxID=175792 RepID=UPI00296AABCF|nr:tripartite motif-containing protein 16-like [Tachysurus vachellii]
MTAELRLTTDPRSVNRRARVAFSSELGIDGSKHCSLVWQFGVWTSWEGDTSSKSSASIHFCRQTLTLDPNTANGHLSLFENNSAVTCSEAVPSFPDHPDKFDIVYNCVVYKSISRKVTGNECRFGNNNQSWSLYCSPFRCSFWHNDKQTKTSKRHSASVIGVYVDYRAGYLSYLSVSDTMKLLHKVQTTFT